MVIHSRRSQKSVPAKVVEQPKKRPVVKKTVEEQSVLETKKAEKKQKVKLDEIVLPEEEVK